MECCWREMARKRFRDPSLQLHSHRQYNHPAAATAAAAVDKAEQFIWFPGPIIVGAGPSGLAVAACLKEKGIPSLVIERSDCIASLWKLKTYDRLCLHLPKHFCELPLMPFPSSFPRYPTKQQFVAYLETYARHFDIQPMFNQTVVNAEYNDWMQSWRVKTTIEATEEKAVTREFISRWLVVATGENAEEVVPEMEGMTEFKGRIIHTSMFKSGEVFEGKRVLVVGCGNSGMEISLDLHDHNSHPHIVVRDTVHVLPREIMGRSTFGLCMWLLKWLPLYAVDRFLLLVSRIVLGDTEKCGISRPHLGPLELKSLSGKTPVLDVGTLAKIQSGDIKVRPGISRLTSDGAEFVDGSIEDFDAIILATGYKSSVLSWLKEGEFFSDKSGLPKRPFPNSWKGKRGLYAVGFTQRGLTGTKIDSRRIAHDIEQCWKARGDVIHEPLSRVLPCQD